MRILIEAHHPAHIHFWKYPVRELIDRGHEVLMIGRDRDGDVEGGVKYGE
jgi:predicted glycosyltransferase